MERISVRDIQLLDVYNETDGICICAEEIDDDDKRNEVTAARKPLSVMDLGDSVVTFDAVHTNPETVGIIAHRGGHYIGGLKGNQGDLLKYTEGLFTHEALKAIEQDGSHFYRTKEIAHDQLENRSFYEMQSTLSQRRGPFALWDKAKSVVCFVKSCTNSLTGRETKEVRYYITSLKGAKLIADYISGHWGVGDCLHNGLDAVFMQDHGSVMDRKAVRNLDVIYKSSLRLLRWCQEMKGLNGRMGKNSIRKCLGWDFENQFREILLLLGPGQLEQCIRVSPKQD